MADEVKPKEKLQCMFIFNQKKTTDRDRHSACFVFILILHADERSKKTSRFKLDNDLKCESQTKHVDD